MQSQRIRFSSHDGHELAGRLERPQGPVRAAALFAHCFTCSKDLAAVRRIAAGLTAQGIAVLRFDFTGLGHSQGEFANTGFSSNVADLRAAAAWMAAQDMAPQLLIGHSLGGAAVLAAAPEITGIRAVATINAPADPAHVLHNLGSDLQRIEADGTAEVTLAGRQFTIARSFVEDVREASISDALRRLRAALLVLHAPRDDTVGIENAQTIFVAARHPKSFVSLDDADHLLTREVDATYAAGVIAAWAARYLDMADEPAPPDAPEGVVRVSEVDAGGLRQEIAAGGHRLAADEPASLGGTNSGPTPYHLLSAALGACTTMTLRMYARRKKLALDHVACDVTHNRCHAEDCEGVEGAAPGQDIFTRRITLRGDLSDDARQRLLAIADKCPVHRTLHAQVAIRTELADDTHDPES